jgi:glutamine phosphoribosylpyrophosphate amidotransferase
MCGISAACVKDGSAAYMAAKIAANQRDRGKDSTGVAFRVGNSGFRIFKRLGKPDKFLRENEGKLKHLSTNQALGHNRWPSCGAITIENAHPFRACDNSFALVHNGSMEIPVGWRTFFEGRGHQVRGDTDSEIMTHEIEEFLKATNGDMLKSLREFNKINKSYSILVLLPDGTIWGTRDSFPAVIVQKANGDTYAASEEDGFKGIIGKEEAAKFLTPRAGTIYRIEADGGVTFWGEYDKEDRKPEFSKKWKWAGGIYPTIPTFGNGWSEWGTPTTTGYKQGYWTKKERKRLRKMDLFAAEKFAEEDELEAVNNETWGTKAND